MTTRLRAKRHQNRTGSTPTRTLVKRITDIPEGMTDAEAAAYYATHDFSSEALSEMPDATQEFAGRVVRKKPISIRFPERRLDELNSVAQWKGVAYQALIKVWLDERLQRERERARRSA